MPISIKIISGLHSRYLETASSPFVARINHSVFQINLIEQIIVVHVLGYQNGSANSPRIVFGFIEFNGFRNVFRPLLQR